MRRRWMAALWLLCALCLLPGFSLATEGGDVFVEPTRNPNASAYDAAHPEQLQAEHIVAYSYILMERSTKQVLFSHNADQLMYPASTTKILTALMALEFGELADVLTVSESALDPYNLPEGSSTVSLKKDEELTLEDALYGMMLRSGNEAANAVAEYVAGDIPTFVERMNRAAAMLGCGSTHFVNAHGYHDDGHYTTAHDLAILMDAALDNEDFRRIIQTAKYTMNPTNKNPARAIENSNVHIQRDNADRYYPPSIGGKTGYHSKAGYVLVEAAEQNGVELIAVVMYANTYSRWVDVSRLFNYGFSQYKSITPEEVYLDPNNPPTVQINGFDVEDPYLGRLTLDMEPEDPSRRVRITGLATEIDSIVDRFSDYAVETWTNLRAPVQMGQVVGTLTFYPDNEPPAVYRLIATRSVAARKDAPLTLEEIEAMVLADPSPLPPFGLDWVLPPVLGALGLVLLLRFALSRLLRLRKRHARLPVPKRRFYT